MKNIIISGGGTGGHLFAAVAFADYVKEMGYEPFIIGSVYGMESEWLKGKEYRYALLKTKGFAGKGLFEKVKSAALVGSSFVEAAVILKSLKPLFVIGFGGYTTVPVIMAARFFHIPAAILEQNSIAGKANRMLAHFCDFIFVNFEVTKKEFGSKKVYVSGNPIRSDIFVPNRAFSGKLKVGVLGGSRGARKINEAMIQFASESGCDIEVIHQTGFEDFERVKSVYEKYKPHWRALPFIDNMAKFYESIDFIICRSGAGTLGEVACASLGSLLVPYPYAIYNHQFYNAKEFEKAGAAILIEDKNLTGKIIESVVSSLSKEKLASMSQKAFALCKRGASETIFKTVMSEIKG